MIEELLKGQPFIIAVLVLAIIALSSVVVYLFKDGRKKDDRYDTLVALRYADLKDFVDSYKEPILEISKTQKGLYDLFSNIYKPGK